MTTYAHAEYDLPSEREPTNFLKLSDYIEDSIAVARLRLLAEKGAEKRASIIGMMNEMFREQGIMGRTTRLESEYAVVSATTADNTFASPDWPEGDTPYEGVFMGCDYIIQEHDTAEMVYLVGLDLNVEPLVGRIVTAPVPESELRVEVEVGAAIEQFDDFDDDSNYLLELEDDIVTANLDELVSMLGSNLTDVDSLKKVGHLMTEMLAQPSVFNDTEASEAVLRLSYQFIDREDEYGITGISMYYTKDEEGETLRLGRRFLKGRIDRIVPAEDFDLVMGEDGMSAKVTLNKHTQPALLIIDDIGDPHMLPLKQLEKMTEEEIEEQVSEEPQTDKANDVPCPPWRDRFIARNKNLFEKE